MPFCWFCHEAAQIPFQSDNCFQSRLTFFGIIFYEDNFKYCKSGPMSTIAKLFTAQAMRYATISLLVLGGGGGA